MQKRCISIANPLELRLFCIKPSKWYLSLIRVGKLHVQSNPVISRAVNSRKSVCRACTLDPKFQWRATRDCPYDRPVTHMCWCEQISPLAHSSQATWQPFNLSHCIEMHNTHLLGRAGQLSQAYFTHSAPILTPRNLPATVNKQWPPLRESCMSRHTRFNTSRKTRWTVYFLVQMQLTGRYDHRPESDFVFLLCRKYRNLSYLKYDSRICHREAHPTLVKRGRLGPATHAWSHFCFLSSRDVVVWLVSTQNPSCVAVHNVWFDSLVA